MNPDQTNNLSLLDKLLGKDGIKTDFRFSFTNDFYWKTGSMLVLVFILCAMSWLMLKNILNK